MSTKTDALPEWAKQRLDKLQVETSHQQATIKALAAEAGDEPDPLLVELAEALQLADLASDSGKGRNMEKVKVSESQDTPSPGSDTRAARNAARKLRKTVENAIQAFDVAREHHWRPPRPDPEPRVRCVWARCEAYGKRIPKYVGPRDSKIELVRCPKCDKRLSAA